MNTPTSAHSKKSSLGGGPSMIGMIRARKLAVKIKKRAKFLVKESRRRDNTGNSAIVHRDFPKLPRTDMHENRQFLHQNNLLALTPSSRSPSVAGSKYSHDTFKIRCPQNTYQPEPVIKFNVAKVKEVIQEVLLENLKGKKYDAFLCKEMSKKLSELLKQRVKFLGYSRYKLLSLVYIGEIRNQGLRIASRCLWNQTTDSVAEGCYRNGNLYAVATVFGIYCE